MRMLRAVLVAGTLWASLIGGGCGDDASGPDDDDGDGDGNGNGNGALNVPAYAGNYAGTWTNTTFGSNGTATAAFVVNQTNHTLTITLDLNGNVFGGGDPPADTFNGTYDASSLTVTGTSPTFGAVTLTAVAGGAFTGSGTNVPSPLIDRVNFSGTSTPQRITLTYTVVFAGGGAQATGTIDLAKTQT